MNLDGPLSPIDYIVSPPTRCRFWDFAASTAETADYTVGVKIARVEDEGLYYVEDVVRGRWGPKDGDDVLYQTAQLDGVDCEICIEEEGGSAGKKVTANVVRLLAGFNVHAERSTGSKMARARAFAAQCEAGNVILVRAEWNAAFIEELSVFPFGKHDDQCLVAGTMITTASGDVPIEDIRPGMRVLTRRGYRRVLDAGMTNPAAAVMKVEMEDGRSLIGTPNHPVFLEGIGFRPLDACSGDVKIVTCEHQGNIGVRDRSKSGSTRGSNSIATRSRPRSTIASISAPRVVTGRWASTGSTGRCGRMPMARSPRAWRFITRTATRSTIPPTISSASPTPSISGCTPRWGPGLPLASGRISIGSGRLRPNGIARRPVAPGTASRPGRATRRGRRSSVVASIAGGFIRRSVEAGRDSAPSPVGMRLGRRACRTGRFRPVPNAGPPSRSRIALAPLRVARVHAAYDVATVFNLRVEGEPEYFANGILVHNCDAAAGAFNRLALGATRGVWGPDPTAPTYARNRPARRGSLGHPWR